MKYKEPKKLPVTIRYIAVVELLFATGMRISELCSLVPDQLDLYGQSVRIWGKGARERIIHTCQSGKLSAAHRAPYPTLSLG